MRNARGAGRVRTPVVRGARDAGRIRTPVVRNARDAGRVRTPVVRGARRRAPSPVPERVPVDARRAGESRAGTSPGQYPSFAMPRPNSRL